MANIKGIRKQVEVNNAAYIFVGTTLAQGIARKVRKIGEKQE